VISLSREYIGSRPFYQESLFGQNSAKAMINKVASSSLGVLPDHEQHSKGAPAVFLMVLQNFEQERHHTSWRGLTTYFCNANVPIQL
jgi:hypothetical protein